MLRNFRRITNNSLGGQVMILLTVVLLATLVIFSVSVYYFVNRTEGAAWQGRQMEAARSAAGTVGGFIQRVKDAMQVVSVIEPDHLVSDSDELNALLQENLALLEIIRVDASGRVVANTFRDKNVLSNLVTIPQSQWFQQARAGQTFIGDVQLSVENAPYLIMAVPSADKGVVVARVKMDVLWNVVQNIHFGQSGEVNVITRAGDVIAHTNPEFALSRQTLFGRPEFSAILAAPNNEWSGSYTDFQDERVVAATVPVPGTDWIVITELNQSEAFADSRTAIYVLGFEATLLLAAASLTTARVIRLLIVKPMEQLRDGADRIGQGDLNHRIHIIRKDEIGQLASAFDSMAADLAKQHVQMQKQNDEIASAYQQLRIELGERQKAQVALKSLNEDLENRVRSRTAELTSEIVERRRVEEQLREAENKFRTLVEQIPAAVFIWELGENGACRYVSPQIQNMLGFPVEEWLTNPDMWKRQLHPDDRERACEDDARALETGKSIPIEYRLMTHDGLAVWFRDEAVILPYEPGQPRLNFGFLTDITEQKQAEERIKASLQEKEVLLKEIHHRVKNNLQIISSLLNLQTYQVKDTGTLRALRDSQARVRSMALIHEKLYQSESLAKIDFGEYVHSLATDLFTSYQRGLGDVRLNLQVDGVALDLDYAVPCGLILNELITNTFKYAFPGGRNGTLTVELRAKPDHTLTLKVSDDGVGLPEGLDIAKAKSLGLQLVNSLVDQVDGTLEIANSHGTSFAVSFKY